MKLQEKISIYYTSLTNTERKICTVILDDPTVVSEHSIIDAATLCGTSKSAMLRFAKKLGYSGYSEFKYAVGESFIKEEKQNTESGNIYQEIVSSYSQTITELSKQDYNIQLTLLAEYIDQYKYVEVIGIGNSSFCAKQLKYSLFSHNKYIGDATDREEIKCLTQCITKDYLIIIFSVSGALDTYGKLVKAASQKKARAVLITMNPDNALEKYVNTSFVLPSTMHLLKDTKVLKQLDNRTTMHFFAEVISYYYGLYLEKQALEG